MTLWSLHVTSHRAFNRREVIYSSSASYWNVIRLVVGEAQNLRVKLCDNPNWFSSKVQCKPYWKWSPGHWVPSVWYQVQQQLFMQVKIFQRAVESLGLDSAQFTQTQPVERGWIWPGHSSQTTLFNPKGVLRGFVPPGLACFYMTLFRA